MHCILQATMQNLFVFIFLTFFNTTRGNRPQNYLLLCFLWCSYSFWIKQRKIKENIEYHVVYTWKNSYKCCTEKSTPLLTQLNIWYIYSITNNTWSQQPLPWNSTFSFELWVACVSVHSKHSIWEASDKTLAPLLGDRMGNAHDTWIIQRKLLGPSKKA